MPIYMKIEGITGPVTGKHRGTIELESCQVGEGKNSVTSSSASQGKRTTDSPQISNLVVTKIQDNASGALFQLSLNGSGKKGTILFTSVDSGTAYMKIELENVLITSFSTSSNGSFKSNKIHEMLTLNATKMQFTMVAAPSSSDQKEWRAAVNAPKPEKSTK